MAGHSTAHVTERLHRAAGTYGCRSSGAVGSAGLDSHCEAKARTSLSNSGIWTSTAPVCRSMCPTSVPSGVFTYSRSLPYLVHRVATSSVMPSHRHTDPSAVIETSEFGSSMSAYGDARSLRRRCRGLLEARPPQELDRAAVMERHGCDSVSFGIASWTRATTPTAATWVTWTPRTQAGDFCADSIRICMSG